MSASEKTEALSPQSVEGFRSTLKEQGDSLVSASQRLIRLLALLKVLVVSFVCLLACLLLDYLMQIEESGFRFLLFGVWLAVSFIFGWVVLRPAWRFAPTKAELASWIELQQPELGDRLSTAVMLAESDFADPRFGSVQFRVSMLDTLQNDPLIGNLAWSKFLDKARLLWASGLVLACALLALAAYSLQPDASGLSLKRFFAPWAANPWPKQDQLAFVDLPTAMGIAESLQVEVIDRQPPLPSDVVLQIRELGESSSVMEIPTAQVNDSAVANLPPFSSPIEIRAVGGDDDTMAWEKIDVIEAPAIEYAQFEIKPPPYSGREPQQIKGRRIRVLEDSEIVLNGTFSKPVAKLSLDNADAAGILDVELEQSGLEFKATTASPMKEPVSWRFEVEAEGLKLKLQELWSIEVVVDEPPQVALATDTLSSVTLQGVLALSGEASDDQGLASVAIHLETTSDEGTASVEQSQVRQDETVLEVWSETQRAKTVKRKSFDEMVSLQSKLENLARGDEVSVWVQAIDSKGQTGTSDVIRLTIADPSQVLAQIEQEQNELNDELRTLVKRQSRNRDQVAIAVERLKEQGRVSRGAVDNFRSLTRNQEGISKSLNESRDSADIKSKLDRVSGLLEANGLADSQIAQSLNELRAKIDSLARKQVKQAEESMGQATEALVSTMDQPLANALGAAQKALDDQQQAAQILEKLIDDIDRQESMRDVERGIERVAKEQRSVGLELEQLQLEALEGANLDEVSDRMKQLGSDQIGLAQGLESLLKRAGELTSEESGGAVGSDPEQAKLQQGLEEVASSLVNQRVAELMREGAQQLNSSQMADASTTQEEIQQALSKALGQRAANKRSIDDISAAELQAASESLGEIADAQRELSAEMRNSESAAAQNDLANRQAELEQRMSDLPRLGSELDMQQAGEFQQQAGQLIQDGQNQEAAAASDRAAEKLNQIQRELQQNAAESREISLEKLQQQTKEISARQSGLVESIANLRQREPELTQQQWRQQTALQADVQDGVKNLLAEISSELEKLPAFELAVGQAQSQMERASASLRRQRLQEASLDASDALRILDQMVDALEEAKREATEDATEGNQQQQSDQEGDQAGKLPPLASLKLLRNMQRDLRQQTLQANSLQESATRRQRLDNLAELQRQLGERVRSLLIEFQSQQQEQSQ